MAGQEKGYEISLDETRNILKFRAWGFWDTDVARRFEQEWTAKVEAISAKHNDWYVLVDLADFPAQSEEVQQLTYEMMELEKHHGVKKEAHLVSKAITKLQIARIARDTNLPENSFFQSEDGAIHWLLND